MPDLTAFKWEITTEWFCSSVWFSFNYLCAKTSSLVWNICTTIFASLMGSYEALTVWWGDIWYMKVEMKMMKVMNLIGKWRYECMYKWMYEWINERNESDNESNESRNEDNLQLQFWYMLQEEKQKNECFNMCTQIGHMKFWTLAPPFISYPI